MLATLFTDLSAMAATAPVPLVGAAITAACVVLFLITRAPEFLVMTLTAAAYGTIAALPFFR